MKTCNRCGQNKPLDMYYKCSRIKDGYIGYCKMCHNKNIKESNKTLYEEVIVGNTYQNTLGEEFKVTDLDGKVAYIYFDELLHGTTTIKKIKQGKVYRNSRTGDIRNKVYEGQRCGNLTILEHAEGRHAKVKTLCDCGTESILRMDYLITGGKSCGCLLRDDSLTLQNFRDSMSKWNPVTHRTDMKRLPIFNLNFDGRGCCITGWTYVDDYTYSKLHKCMLVKSAYVLIYMGKLNSEALGIKYNPTNKTIPLHCWVKAMPTGVHNLVTDHKNGCKLDNRPENLRIATYKENAGNSKSNAVSGYKGVKFKTDKPRSKPWYASQSEIINGKQYEYGLGYYTNKEDAAKAVDVFNIERYGEFARLNLKRSIYEDMGLLPKTQKKYKLP